MVYQTTEVPWLEVECTYTPNGGEFNKWTFIKGVSKIWENQSRTVQYPGLMIGKPFFILGLKGLEEWSRDCTPERVVAGGGCLAVGEEIL